MSYVQCTSSKISGIKSHGRTKNLKTGDFTPRQTTALYKSRSVVIHNCRKKRNLYENIPIEGVLSRNYTTNEQHRHKVRELFVAWRRKLKIKFPCLSSRKKHSWSFSSGIETICLTYNWWGWAPSINFNTNCILFSIWAKANPINFVNHSKDFFQTCRSQSSISFDYFCHFNSKSL